MDIDDLPILGRDRQELLFKQVLAQYGAPAFVRRARQVQDAYEQLLDRCRRQREEWLPSARLCLERLSALVGNWERLTAWLGDEYQVEILRHLQTELQPR